MQVKKESSALQKLIHGVILERRNQMMRIHEEDVSGLHHVPGCYSMMAMPTRRGNVFQNLNESNLMTWKILTKSTCQVMEIRGVFTEGPVVVVVTRNCSSFT